MAGRGLGLGSLRGLEGHAGVQARETGAPAPALGSRSTRHCSLCYWIESSKNTCEVSGVADVGGVAGMALRVLVWLKRRETRTCWQQPQR